MWSLRSPPFVCLSWSEAPSENADSQRIPMHKHTSLERLFLIFLTDIPTAPFINVHSSVAYFCALSLPVAGMLCSASAWFAVGSNTASNMPGTLNHLKITAVLVFALAAPHHGALAQAVKGLDAPDAGANSPAGIDADKPSSFLIEPEAEIKGDQIKRRTYRSQAVGQNKNWDLDIGGFQAPVDEDPNRLVEDLEDSNYSGMRLRLPFRGRTGQ